MLRDFRSISNALTHLENVGLFAHSWLYDYFCHIDRLEGIVMIVEANPFRIYLPRAPRPPPKGYCSGYFPSYLRCRRHADAAGMCCLPVARPINPLCRIVSMSAPPSTPAIRRTPFPQAPTSRRGTPMTHSTRQGVGFPGNSYSQLAILSNPFENIGVFLILVQQDQGSRILPVLEPSPSERRQVAAYGQPTRPSCWRVR